LRLDSEVLYPPVDTEFFTHDDKKETNLVLSICRLHPKKRSELMIELFRRFDGNYRFVLAGAIEKKFEDYKRQLTELASRDKRVQILFNPSDEEIKQLYQKATLFWYTYSKEEFGMPVAEAMSCGAPVVAFYGGGVNEIVDNNRTGFLVHSGEEFLKKTEFVLNHPHDRHQMSVNARERVEEMFSLNTFRRKIQTTLSNVFRQQDSVSSFRNMQDFGKCND
jgi:glycosyltransferase involved in cell wall biosynthesis